MPPVPEQGAYLLKKRREKRASNATPRKSSTVALTLTTGTMASASWSHLRKRREQRASNTTPRKSSTVALTLTMGTIATSSWSHLRKWVSACVQFEWALFKGLTFTPQRPRSSRKKSKPQVLSDLL